MQLYLAPGRHIIELYLPSVIAIDHHNPFTNSLQAEHLIQEEAIMVQSVFPPASPAALSLKDQQTRSTSSGPELHLRVLLRPAMCTRACTLCVCVVTVPSGSGDNGTSQAKHSLCPWLLYLTVLRRPSDLNSR